MYFTVFSILSQNSGINFIIKIKRNEIDASEIYQFEVIEIFLFFNKHDKVKLFLDIFTNFQFDFRRLV